MRRSWARSCSSRAARRRPCAGARRPPRRGAVRPPSAARQLQIATDLAYNLDHDQAACRARAGHARPSRRRRAAARARDADLAEPAVQARHGAGRELPRPGVEGRRQGRGAADRRQRRVPDPGRPLDRPVRGAAEAPAGRSDGDVRARVGPRPAGVLVGDHRRQGDGRVRRRPAAPTTCTSGC